MLSECIRVTLVPPTTAAAARRANSVICGLVDDGRVTLPDLGVHRAVMQLPHRGGHPHYRVAQMSSYLGIHGTDGSGQPGGAGNDVLGGSGVETPHRQYRRISGVDLPGDDRLEHVHQRRSGNHRVHCLMGPGGVTGPALDVDREVVGGGVHRAVRDYEFIPPGS